MLFIILKSLITVACVYGAYKVAKSYFDDNQKLLRVLATFVLIIVFAGIANGVLSLITPRFNVEKQLQNEERYVALKQRYPQEYQLIVEKVDLGAQKHKLEENEVVELADQYIAPLTLKLVASASDASRYEFANSFIKNITLSKSKGGTLCYDMMHNQDNINNEQKKIVSDIFDQSGMHRAMLTVINDNKVGNAIVSQKDMDKMEKKIFHQLAKKHGQDMALLINPKKAITTDSKQTVCQITVDMFDLMNDPNDKAKKALLRRNMQNIADDMNNVGIRSNGPKIALATENAVEPQMAASAF